VFVIWARYLVYEKFESGGRGRTGKTDMGVDSIFETGALVYLGDRGGRRERGTRGKGMLNRRQARYGI